MVRCVSSALWSAILGQGLQPYSLWLFSLGLPTLVLFWNIRKDESNYSWLVWWAAGVVSAWTVPTETLGQVIVDMGKLRAALVKIIPVLPAVASKLPAMLLVVYPIFPELLPHIGTVAPYLHLLLPHAEFLTKVIPKLSSRIDDLVPLLDKIGPLFGKLTPSHLQKLEMIIDDVVEKLDVIAPHIDQLMPVIEDGIMVAPKMMPYIEVIAPHLDALENDLTWLLPLAAIDGIEDLLPLMDEVAPLIRKVKPFAEALAPIIPKIKPHIPNLSGNLDVLLDEINCDVIHNLDPLLYWCGRFLPLADYMGILKSRALLRTFIPMARYLPPVPTKPPRRLSASCVEEEEEGNEWWRHPAVSERSITVPSIKYIGNIVYYIIQVDTKYAGEFRYRHLRELHEGIHEFLREGSPEFPQKFFVFQPTNQDIEKRMIAIERYLVHIMSDPNICSSLPFAHFIRIHRRWSDDEDVSSQIPEN